MTEGATTRCQIPPGPAGAAPQAERSAGGFSFNPGAVWDESPLGLRYLGFERKTLRNVLVTLVRPELSRDPGFQECFRREIDLVRRLSHVHLSRTLGSGVFEGQLFYATEPIPGSSLDEQLRSGTRFSTEEILHIGQGVCQALRAAESFGIIPLRPTSRNVVLDSDGMVRVEDPGLARMLEGVPGLGNSVECSAYLTPEAARGEKPSVQSDVYSLGVLLYELAVGKPPFEGHESRTSFVFQVLNIAPVLPHDAAAGVSRDLERVLLRCLAKDPADRPAGPAELEKELESVRELLKAVPAGQNGEGEGGDFEIYEDQVLARGGMGVLYRARQRSLDRKVAVKVIRDLHLGESDFRERFRAEAELLAQVRDGHVVQVFGAGTWKGRPFYAMELVEGEDLGARLSRQQVLRIPEVLQVAQGIGSALAALWKFKIVHRDLKPSNILWATDGTVKLTDFGLAKNVRTRRNDTQYILGTVGYLSPEQAQGDAVDVRSDLYSLGVVLYELATGALPNPEQVPGAGSAPSDVTARVPEGLLKLIHRCMAKNADDRYQTPEEFLRGVAAVSRGIEGPEHAGPARPGEGDTRIERFKQAHCLPLEEEGALAGYSLALALGDHARAMDLAERSLGRGSREYAAAEARAREAELHVKEAQALQKFREQDWEGALSLYRAMFDQVGPARQAELRAAVDICERLHWAATLEEKEAWEDSLRAYAEIRSYYGALSGAVIEERVRSLEMKMKT